MAAPPKTTGLSLEDFKEAPAWFSKLLQPLNEFISSVSLALSGRLSRGANLLGYYESFDFTTQPTADNTFPLRFKNKLPGGVKPRSVKLGQIYKANRIAMSAAWSPEWVLNQSGEIELTITGLENSTRYIGTIEIDG